MTWVIPCTISRLKFLCAFEKCRQLLDGLLTGQFLHFNTHIKDPKQTVDLNIYPLYNVVHDKHYSLHRAAIMAVHYLIVYVLDNMVCMV